MARKRKLTKELIKEAYKLVAAGNYDKDVYPILGIDKSTWYRWLSEGETAKSGLKREFYDTVKKAEKDAIARNVALIQTTCSARRELASSSVVVRKEVF